MHWLWMMIVIFYSLQSWLWWFLQMVRLGGLQKGFAQVSVDLRGEAPKWWMVHFRRFGVDTWGWMPQDGCTWTFWVRRSQLGWARYLATTERPPVAWDSSRGARGWERMAAALFGWSFGSSRSARGRRAGSHKAVSKNSFNGRISR